MSKLTKDQKRKAKLKDRKRRAENIFNDRVHQLAHSLEVLCEPIIPKYLDATKNPDLEGYKIAYTIGLYAWNICVSGKTDLTKIALKSEVYNPEQLAIIEKDIGDLIRRKYELYPNNTTAIFDVIAVAVNGVPHAKIHMGRTFPKIPEVDWITNSQDISAEEIADLRKKMKLTQVKFGGLFGVTARKISEWEHGKSKPTEEQLIALNKQKKQI